MRQQFSIPVYADIIFVYGFCDGNDKVATREYQNLFSERWVPNHLQFGSVLNALKENRTFTKSKSEQELDRLQEVKRWQSIRKY